MKKAVFLHIFYSHLYEEILQALKKTNFDFNLYVNLVEGHSDMLKESLLKEFQEAVVLISPNQGMDCGGQLRILNYWLKQGKNEELLVFIHSKGKPVDYPDKVKVEEVDTLRELLMSIIRPDKSSLIEPAFQDESVGMVGVKEWYLRPPIPHGYPIPECKYYCDMLNLKNYENNSFGFIGGTMFWVRASIYKKVFESLDIIKLVGELPPYSNGGNIHALERIFGYIVLNEGYKITGV